MRKRKSLVTIVGYCIIAFCALVGLYIILPFGDKAKAKNFRAIDIQDSIISTKSQFYVYFEEEEKSDVSLITATTSVGIGEELARVAKEELDHCEASKELEAHAKRYWYWYYLIGNNNIKAGESVDDSDARASKNVHAQRKDHWCCEFVTCILKYTGLIDRGIASRQSSCTSSMKWYIDNGAQCTILTTGRMYNEVMGVFKEQMGSARLQKINLTDDYEPMPGDLIYFRYEGTNAEAIGHIGIVYEVTESEVTTIEGNRNGGGKPDKSKVIKDVYKRDSPDIAGYVRLGY